MNNIENIMINSYILGALVLILFAIIAVVAKKDK
jgi:hypothetical protein